MHVLKIDEASMAIRRRREKMLPRRLNLQLTEVLWQAIEAASKETGFSRGIVARWAIEHGLADAVAYGRRRAEEEE